MSQVSVIGSGRETDLKQASIKFRLNRNPVRRFSSISALLSRSVSAHSQLCAAASTLKNQEVDDSVLSTVGSPVCAGDWRQVLLTAWAEGRAVAAVAGRGHAV